MNLDATHPLRLLLTAVQFYTRIPVPRWVGHSDAQLAAATPFFVVVGVGLGALTGLSFALAQLAFGGAIAAVLAIAFGVLLTGAFHEDGFADVCDGFGGGYTPERVLEIMKDSRVGAFGAIGIGLMLLLQILALAEARHGLWALIAAHAVSRALALVLVLALPYVREDASSKVKPVVTHLDRGLLGAALVTGAAPLIACAVWVDWHAAAAAGLLAVLATGAMGRLCYQRLGGYTGDCLGAAQQVAFAAVLLGFAYRG